MRAEYLLFDLFVACPLLALAWLRPQWAPGFWRPALRATVLGAAPFIGWDVAVVGRHWWFHPDRILGVSLAGLPLEEIGFFLVVPLACLVTWELALGAARARPTMRGRPGAFAIAAGVCAVIAAAAGREYTALGCASLGAAALLDDALGTRLLSMRAAWIHAAVVLGLTGVFNGFLTGRPIVIYAPEVQLGVHLGTIPVEDFAFGLALVWVTTALYQRRRGRTFGPSWLARAIRARFGGYEHTVRSVDSSLPSRIDRRCRVAVIGGGLAGMSAAELLSRRGFEVVLFERDAELGGKLAGWREVLPDGFDAPVEHGFHAFFRHYYNLLRWLGEVGVAAHLRPIPDYAILARDGQQLGFATANTTPLLNLAGLADKGFFRWRDVLHPRTGRSLEMLLRYDADHDDEALDATSFASWAAAADLPPRLRLVFTTFARAFFADEARMSMAELVKSFHFYYLSHDHGLTFDYLDGASNEVFVDPIVARLRAAGVEIRTGHGVERIGEGLEVEGVHYEHVVLAADAAASARILAASPAFASQPTIAEGMGSMRAGQRYAIMRVWISDVAGEDLPPFVVTERARILDAIAFVHRTDPRAGAWASEHHGAVLELHCYAVPDDVADADVEPLLWAEAETFVPALATASVCHRHVQLQADFTALHLGMRRSRPTIDSGVPGLWFAGDWVKLPVPAMLMEAAHTSALLAADRICAHEGVAGFAVTSVPLRGVLVSRRG